MIIIVPEQEESTNCQESSKKGEILFAMECEREIREGCMEEMALQLLLEYDSFSTGREVEYEGEEGNAPG